MLVVEGPDLVGKTTFCAKLAEELEAQYGMLTAYVHHGAEAAGWGPRDYCRVVRPKTICDRLHMGDVVYGKVLDREERISPQDYLRVDAMVRMAGGMVVLIDSDPSSYAELVNANDREELFDDSTIMQAARLYWQVAQDIDDVIAPWTLSYDEHWPVIVTRDDGPLYASDEFVVRVAARYATLQLGLEAVGHGWLLAWLEENASTERGNMTAEEWAVAELEVED